jgi:serine/threonine protein phosphatase PrpC
MIIIASDGVWEFLTNEQVAQIAMGFYGEGLAE